MNGETIQIEVPKRELVAAFLEKMPPSSAPPIDGSSAVRACMSVNGMSSSSRVRAQHYIRYVDDFILLHEHPQQLNAWLADIAAFLPRELGVRLNPAKTILQPVDRGIDFVGHVIKPHRTTLRRRTFNDALHRLAAMPAAELYPAANSYLGLARQATHSHHDRSRIANLVRRRGLAVDQRLTKVYR